MAKSKQYIHIFISLFFLYNISLKPIENTQQLTKNLETILTDPQEIINKTDYACSAKLTQLISELPHQNFSVLKFVQQSGKGINDLGLFTQCNKNPNSRYTLMQLKIYPFSLFWGLCGPVECTVKSYSYLKTDLANVINYGIAMNNQNAVAPIPQITQQNITFTDSVAQNAKLRSFTTGTIFMLLLTSFIILLVVIGTIFSFMGCFEQRKSNGQEELISQQQQRPLSCSLRFLKAFSLGINCKSLCKPTTVNSEDRTNVLNGVRVMSMGWVILGHSFFFTLQGAVTNLNDLKDLMSVGWFSIIETGTYSVDVFFLLSGFLATYIILARMHKKDGSTEGPHITILHRYIRLFPLYAYVMLGFITLMPLLAWGPIFFTYTVQMDGCKQGWWAHFLYINNFVTYGKRDGVNYCMGWTWYLPNDFQFYIVAALLVPIFYKRPYLSLALIGLVTLVCEIISIVIVTKYSISLSVVKFNQNGFPKYYTKPYTRISPFIVGIIAGIMYYQYSITATKIQKQGIYTSNQPIQREKPVERVKCFDKINYLVKKSSTFRWVSYILGFITLQLIVLAHYSLNSYPYSWNKFQDTLFTLLSRPLFVIALLAIIYPAMLGHASWIYNILGWSGWTPFAKVTYGAYLIHPFFMQLVAYNSQGGLYVSGPTCLFLFVPYTALVFSLAIVLHLFVEAPFANLEKEFIQPLLSCRCCRKKKRPVIKSNEFENVQTLDIEGDDDSNNKFRDLRRQENSLGVV